jgi:hypothetical protein
MDLRVQQRSVVQTKPCARPIIAKQGEMPKKNDFWQQEPGGIVLRPLNSVQFA